MAVRVAISATETRAISIREAISTTETRAVSIREAISTSETREILGQAATTVAPWDFFSARASDYAIEITADAFEDSGVRNQYFDVGNTPPRGTLLRAHPADMFTNAAIQRIGRFWHSFGNSIQHVHFHRRGGGVAWSAFLGTLGPNGAVYIINTTDSEYLVFDATNTTDSLTFNRPSSAGNNFVNWTQTDINDDIVASNPDPIDTPTWLAALENKTLIIALSTQQTYVPFA